MSPHHLLPVLALLALTSCQAAPPSEVASNSTSDPGSTATLLADRDQQIAKLTAEVASLKAAAAAAGAKTSTLRPAVDAVEANETRAPTKAAVAMCYKDYCPCDPPQGGPDSVLCDQLEAGEDVAVDSMIAGRGMREARRQIQASGF